MKASYLAGVLMAALFALLVISGYRGGSAAFDVGDSAGKSAAVDTNGGLRVPGDYRTDYQFLGSWAVAAEQGQGAKELHVVYASPGALAAYRRDRQFPDGAVLVKEVFAASTTGMTTGTVSHAQTLKGWFVMVKDAAGRHSGSLWGEGWGWSWFDAGNPNKTTSTDYRTNCRGCHVPAQATGWIYVDGYPPLRP